MLLLIAQTNNHWWVKTSLQLQQQPLKCAMPVTATFMSACLVWIVSLQCGRLLVVGDFKEHRLCSAASLPRALTYRRLSFHLFLWYTKRSLQKNMTLCAWQQPPVLYCIMYNSMKGYCIKAQHCEYMYLQCSFVLFWSFPGVFDKAISNRRCASRQLNLVHVARARSRMQERKMYFLMWIWHTELWIQTLLLSETYHKHYSGDKHDIIEWICNTGTTQSKQVGKRDDVMRRRNERGYDAVPDANQRQAE